VVTYIAQAFWLALAVTVCGTLHMVVVKNDLFPALRVPIDGGRMLGGERIFGDHKTWRGVVFMVVVSALVGAIQGGLGGAWAASAGAACIDFASFGIGTGPIRQASGYALVNALLGFGYVLGELPNSFCKRRLRITPGKTDGGLKGHIFFVVDQADSVVTALVLGALVFGWSAALVVVGTLALALLHLSVNASLHAMRVRKNL
jgi:hypothetical protein